MSDVDSAQWSDGGHEWGITADSLVIYQKRESPEREREIQRERKVTYLSCPTLLYRIDKKSDILVPVTS